MAVCAPLPLLTFLASLEGQEPPAQVPAKQTALRLGFIGQNARLTMAGHDFLQQVTTGALDDASATLEAHWPAYKALMDTLREHGKFRPWHDPFNCRSVAITRDDLQDRLPLYAYQLGQAWLSNEMAYQISYGGARPKVVDFGMEMLNVMNGRELSVEALFHALCLALKMTPWAVHRTFLRAWARTSLKTLVDLYQAPADFQVNFRTESTLAVIRGEVKLVSVPANVIVSQGGERFSIVAPK